MEDILKINYSCCKYIFFYFSGLVKPNSLRGPSFTSLGVYEKYLQSQRQCVQIAFVSQGLTPLCWRLNAKRSFVSSVCTWRQWRYGCIAYWVWCWCQLQVGFLILTGKKGTLRRHSVDISKFFCHLHFTWNQFRDCRNSKTRSQNTWRIMKKW